MPKNELEMSRKCKSSCVSSVPGFGRDVGSDRDWQMFQHRGCRGANLK